jgi:hypothetical protein
MKRMTLTVTALAVLFLSTMAGAQTQAPIEHGIHFVDLNGDGLNDNAPDIDQDGIPNGQDPDYVRSAAGRGADMNFVDENGDGINDHAPDTDGDGIPNGQDSDWVKPLDGSGSRTGRGAQIGNGFLQSGVCTGAGAATGTSMGKVGIRFGKGK